MNCASVEDTICYRCGDQTDFYYFHAGGRAAETYFRERKEAGFSKINLTFAGTEKIHDAWVGRRGEYRFLLMIARIAADIGMKRRENLLLTKSTIPQLEALMDTLDNIPGPSERHIGPVAYVGRGKNLEHERITPDTLEQLSGCVLRHTAMEGHKTERAWILSLRNGYEDPSLNEKFVHVRLHEDNIDEIESKDCGEIIADYKKRYDKVHAVVPRIARTGRYVWGQFQYTAISPRRAGKKMDRALFKG